MTRRCSASTILMSTSGGSRRLSCSDTFHSVCSIVFCFFQAEDGIRDIGVTGVQTCALPIYLLVTPGHPFYVSGRGFVSVEELQVGDELVSLATQTHLRMRALRLESRQGTTYNLTVETGHTFFVGGLGTWVHNVGPCNTCVNGTCGVDLEGASTNKLTGGVDVSGVPSFPIRSVESSLGKIDQLRRSLEVGGRRDIAFAEYNINGEIGELVGVSGGASRFGTV